MERVVVTGGTGFVGAHMAARLMYDDEHEVLVTVRAATQEDEAMTLSKRAGVNPDIVDELEIEAADLLSDDGWVKAFADADIVIHAASPFPVESPANDDDLIVPAREGTLRVLRAAREAGVRRVVMISCFSAVAYGQPARATAFTEADWTDPDGPGVTVYQRAATLAERAARDFVADGNGPELVVIHPVALWGPMISKDLPITGVIALTMLKGGLPFVGPVQTNLLDVRDLADLVVRAMLHPDAAGRRLVAASGEPVGLSSIAKTMGVRSLKVPRWASRRDSPDLVVLEQMMGEPRAADSSLAHSLLGWKPRPVDKTLRDTAASLRDLGLLSPDLETSMRESR